MGNNEVNVDREHGPIAPADPGWITWAPYLLVVVVLGLGCYLGVRWWQVESRLETHAEAIAAAEVGPPLKDFELVERSGEPFRSVELRGQVWVASYFFTTCPGACVQLNQRIRQLHNQDDLRDVTWVSITCDPETDSLDALRQYADHYQADPQRWLFCRGDLDDIKQIAFGMGVEVYRKSHKTFVVVVDKRGDVRGVYDAVGDKRDLERLQRRLKQLLAEPYQP